MKNVGAPSGSSCGVGMGTQHVQKVSLRHPILVSQLIDAGTTLKGS